MLTDEEKETLSEEEIAAMTEEGDGTKTDKEDNASDDSSRSSTNDDQAAKEEEADKDKKDEGKEETEDDESADADKADEDKDDDKEAAEDKKSGDDKGSEESLPEPRPFTPKFTEIDQAELDDLKTALDDARKKFDDGEIDYAVLDEIKDKYNEARWKADFAQESNQNMIEQRWKWEQERFLDDNTQYRDNRTLNAAFVGVVNNIIVTEEGKRLTDREVLIKAKEQVEADLGIGAKDDPPEKTDEEKRKAIKAAKKAKGDRSKIPPDIGGLPVSEENEDADEFAYLDKLEGEAYQAAIDKLTPEQLRRYEDS